MLKNLVATTLLLALSVSTPALAQAQMQTVPKSAPMAVAIPDTVPDARDVPYPGGPMKLDIDASDTVRAAYRVTQTIPVAANTRKLTLLYPQWLPGNHGPRGPLAELVDVRLFSRAASRLSGGATRLRSLPSTSNCPPARAK